MALYLPTAGDKLTAARLKTYYDLLKGIAGGEDAVRLAKNVDDTLLLQPTVDPASVVKLFRVKSQAGTEKYAVRSDGVPVLCDQAGTPGSLEDGMLWRNGSLFYGRIGGATVALFTPAAASIIYAVRSPADVTNSTVDPADITGLSFSVLANKDYFFEAQLIFQTAATTTGIALGVNAPSTPTSIATVGQIAQATGVLSGFFINNNGYVGPTPDVAAANTSYPAFLRGVLQNGASAGTFSVRLASEVGGSVVRVKAGSVLRWQQLN
jgi:hypothetical protein